MEAAVGLQDCGDDVLLQIMSHLSIKQRCSLACVDRRLRGLAAAPSLLRSLHVELDGSVQELSSFFGWLAAVAAPHVEELSLAINREDEGGEQDGYSALYSDAALAALQAGVHDLGAAAPHLAAFRLDLRGHFTLGSAFCGALPPSLRLLKVACAADLSACLRVEDGLGRLAALARLHLHAADVRFERAPGRAPPTLPATLTNLTLSNYRADPVPAALPQEITALSMLRSLQLYGLNPQLTDFRRLTHLRALEQLHLVECEALPVCLGQVPALRALRLQGLGWRPEDWVDVLARVVGPVANRLTHLALVEHEAPLPACLPEMARLERFCCHISLVHVSDLPPGPWLRSLRQAALPARVAAASLGALSAATRLEALALFSCSGGGAAAALEVAAWAAQRSGLRTLELWPVGLLLRSSPAYAWRELDAGLARLQLPPSLRVLRGNELARELALLSDAA